MKKASMVTFCVGLFATLFFSSSLYSSLTGDALGGGYGVMLIGYPLILVSVILFIISLFIHKNK